MFGNKFAAVYLELILINIMVLFCELNVCFKTIHICKYLCVIVADEHKLCEQKNHEPKDSKIYERLL